MVGLHVHVYLWPSCGFTLGSVKIPSITINKLKISPCLTYLVSVVVDGLSSKVPHAVLQRIGLHHTLVILRITLLSVDLDLPICDIDAVRYCLPQQLKHVIHVQFIDKSPVGQRLYEAVTMKLSPSILVIWVVIH